MRVFERSWLWGAIAFAAYAALAAPHVVAGDNAEFATLGALGGGAHPSGYPSYVLWLRAWSWLPAGSAAHRTALATAILGGAAIGVLHAACRAWGARPAAAAFAVALGGAAPLVLQYATEAEVFAMNGLCAALILWLAADGGPLRGAWRGGALGLVAGVGLANHLTCVLLAPIGLYGVIRAMREPRSPGPDAAPVQTIALAVLGLALGLALYGYLLIAGGPASWGSVGSLGALLDTFLRREYGGARLYQGGTDVPWTTSLAALAVTVGRSWLWLPAVAGVAALGVRIWRPAGASRWAWLLLAASLLLAGPVLVSQFNVAPSGIGLYVCRRFHLLPALLLTVPVAAAVDPLCARLRPAVAAALAAVLFAGLVIAGLPGLARFHGPAMERGVQNLLRSLPPRAVVALISEDQCLGARYLQLTAGERPDVALVCTELLRRDWYRTDWARRGLVMPADPDARLGEALLAAGRPVLVDGGLTGIVRAFPSYPYGVVYHVLPPGGAPPSAAEIAAINRTVFAGFSLDYAWPGRDDDFAAVAHRRYTAAWVAIAGLLEAAGDRAGASDALDVARAYQPVQTP